jgi:4-carboxymuconolactone decarboxylase
VHNDIPLFDGTASRCDNLKLSGAINVREMSAKTQRGQRLLGELLGADAAAAARERVSSGEFGSELTRIGLDFAFEEIWSRPGLDRRSRSLVIIGILIARGASQELRNHFRIGLRNGLIPRELEEVIIQSLPYVGFPGASPALSDLVHVLRELNIDTGGKTLEERGLL